MMIHANTHQFLGYGVGSYLNGSGQNEHEEVLHGQAFHKDHLWMVQHHLADGGRGVHAVVVHLALVRVAKHEVKHHRHRRNAKDEREEE
jgi:hypothetical protein